MPRVEVTDPDVLKAFGPAPSGGTGPSGRQEVTDPDVLKAFGATPTVVQEAPAAIAASAPPTRVALGEQAPGDASAAVGAGILEGVPIAGPAAKGGLDRVAAFIRAVQNGTSYTDELKNVQDFSKATEDAHPWAATGGRIGGSVAAGLAAAPVVGPALAALPRVGAVAGATAGGAAIGSVDGAIRAEPGNRAEGAVIGGALGGAGGAVGASVADLAGAGIRGAVNAVTRAGALRGVGLSTPAANVLTRTLEADGSFGGQGARNLAAAGPEAMLADAGGNAAGVLDTAMQRGGPGANFARQAIEDRAARAGQTVNAALDQGLGPAQGVQTTTTNLRTGTAAARRNAYDTAYDTPIDYSAQTGRDVEEAVQRVPPDVINTANRLMSIEGHQSRQIRINMNDDGTYTYERQPDVRQIDYITRALNQHASSGEGQGALGGQTDIGRAYGNLARDIRQPLRANVPEYGTALDTAAHPIEARNALNFGATLLRPNVARDVVAETMKGMSQAEQTHVRLGLRAQIDETVANVKRTITDPNVDARQAMQSIKDLSSDAARDKLRLVLGQQQADALLGQVDQAAQAFQLRAATTRNSATFARQATNQAVRDATEPGVFGQALRGKPIKVGQAVAQAATGTRPADDLARQDGIYNEISRALTERRGADAMNLLARLAQANRQTQRADTLARLYAPYAGGAVGGASYQGTKRLLEQPR